MHIERGPGRERERERRTAYTTTVKWTSLLYFQLLITIIRERKRRIGRGREREID